jgi:hypothetical protein
MKRTLLPEPGQRPDCCPRQAPIARWRTTLQVHDPRHQRRRCHQEARWAHSWRMPSSATRPAKTKARASGTLPGRRYRTAAGYGRPRYPKARQRCHRDKRGQHLPAVQRLPTTTRPDSRVALGSKAAVTLRHGRRLPLARDAVLYASSWVRRRGGRQPRRSVLRGHDAAVTWPGGVVSVIHPRSGWCQGVVLENGRRAALAVALPRRIAPDAYQSAI